MNYKKIYNQLIQKRQEISITGYSEKHHIIPSSLGGGNEKSNIVKLTAREHFIAHRLLAKIHGGKMWYALSLMMRTNIKSAKGVKVTSRAYQTIKENDSKVRSVAMKGANNHFYGKTFTPDQLNKLKGSRPSVSGSKNPNYGVSNKDRNELVSYIHKYKPRPFTIDYSVHDLINNSLGILTNKARYGRLKPLHIVDLNRYYRGLGLTKPDRDYVGSKNPNYNNGQAISGDKNPMFGKEHKDSTKAKIGAKAKRRIICHHCGKDGNIANMHRWHLDNCRNKSGS